MTHPTLEKSQPSAPDLQVLTPSQSAEMDRISPKNVRLPRFSLLEGGSSRFRLIPGRDGVIRVDVQSVREALRQTMEKYAEFFEV